MMKRLFLLSCCLTVVFSQVLFAEESKKPNASPYPEALFGSFSTDVRNAGKILFLYGRVVNLDGKAIPNAVVEIWQTDRDGHYDHPNDSDTDKRDRSFGFYGSAQTDKFGWYVFRTLLPGKYFPRPRHIHYKVKQNGNTLLTSQFYFRDRAKKADSAEALRALKQDRDLLSLRLTKYQDKLIAKGNIYISDGTRGEKYEKTPSQTEGPYYPVNNVSDFDNDLFSPGK